MSHVWMTPTPTHRYTQTHTHKDTHAHTRTPTRYQQGERASEGWMREPDTLLAKIRPVLFARQKCLCIKKKNGLCVRKCVYKRESVCIPPVLFARLECLCINNNINNKKMYVCEEIRVECMCIKINICAYVRKYACERACRIWPVWFAPQECLCIKQNKYVIVRKRVYVWKSVCNRPALFAR